MRQLISSLFLSAAMSLTAAPSTAQIITLTTRPHVTQSYFLASVPESPRAIALLFAGASGRIRLRTEGDQVQFSGSNFLLRAHKEFVHREAITAIPDAPSDQMSSGMSDEFRYSEAHYSDIAAVVANLKERFPGLPVFLIGTSRGALSAAALGRAFGDEIAGIVLSSSLFVRERNSLGLNGFDYARIKAPVLLVHHSNDACRFTPYRDARTLAATRGYPLITVNGGMPPTSGPCDPFSAHGFLGREIPTVDAIVKWMLKKPYSAVIE